MDLFGRIRVMPKYYVSSGDLQTCIIANNHRAAAVKVFKRIGELDDAPALGVLTFVSEHTFDVMNCAEEDVFCATPEIIHEAGIEDIYDLENVEENE